MIDKESNLLKLLVDMNDRLEEASNYMKTFAEMGVFLDETNKYLKNKSWQNKKFCMDVKAIILGNEND